MTDHYDFEYIVLKHYHRKGLFARSNLIQQLIIDLRNFESRTTYDSTIREIKLNDDEIVSTLQIAIIAHIMMFIEDLAVICKSISEGRINYYDFLDRSGNEDLGVVIGKFYDEINKSHDDVFMKLLSYVCLENFEFVNDLERKQIQKVMNKMIERVRIFFNKITFFRQNHIKIFRRYKHAGFPILLVQQIPNVMMEYRNYKFASVGLTSNNKIDDEMVPIPYSSKAIESYENIKNDIFSFLGVIINFKLICIERKVDGVIPSTHHTFRMDLTEEEKTTLDDVWKKFEMKYPIDMNTKIEVQVPFNSEILRWYTDIDNSSKRVL